MDEIKKAIQDARASRIEHIYGQFSNVADVQESETDIKKADDAEEHGETEETDEYKEKETDAEGNAENVVETDEETSEEDSTEKSDIMYAFGGGDIKISKTGKQIKEQVDNVILPELNAALAVKENEATEKLKECGQAPTACVPVWWTGDVKMDIGYKFYDWRETEFCKPENQRMYATLSANDEAEKKGNCPTSEGEAIARCAYNEIVRCICNIKVDIKACEILKTLKDTTEYELTPRQVLTLKF